MQNEDRIRVLENKLEYAEKQMRKLRQKTEVQDMGLRQLNEAAEALFIDIVRRYGEKREDEDGVHGYRLPIGMVNVAEVLAEWRLAVTDNEIEGRVLGAFPRREKD